MLFGLNAYKITLYANIHLQLNVYFLKYGITTKKKTFLEANKWHKLLLLVLKCIYPHQDFILPSKQMPERLFNINRILWGYAPLELRKKFWSIYCGVSLNI